MREILDLFAGNLGAVRFLAGFVALPFLYLKESEDVHDDVTEALTSGAGQKIDKVRLRAAMYLFELDWWLIAVCGAFLGGIFALGDLGAGQHCAFLAPRVGPSELEAARTAVRGSLNVFGTVIALAAVFLVLWCKVGVKKVIQESCW